MVWQEILRKNFTHWEKLAIFLELENREFILQNSNFPLNLPLRLAQKVKKNNIDDPVLKQFLPTIRETEQSASFQTDPVNDQFFRKSAKLLHKYEGRALLVCTSACAMHCRYCFRQHFDYETKDKTYASELNLIAQDSSIHEVILSGGDPLALSDGKLEQIILSLAEIKHVKRIRFHTRFPIGIPERINESFLKVLLKAKQQIWFVSHINHPRELDEDVFFAFRQLQNMGIPVLNQAVLLRGVNDDLETLKDLWETLADRGIYAYYLHQLDRVQGAAHFEVPEHKGKQLVQELAKCLPGYAVPKYVREVAGEPSKSLLT